MASAAARERFARKNEQDELERAFRTIDKKGDDKIDPEGVHYFTSCLSTRLPVEVIVTDLHPMVLKE
jgi:Ca2+-binding EF-hand superfamily protein